MGDVQELAAVAPRRDVGDDVKLLSGVAERALERLVEEGRDDQLMGQPACAQDRGQRREQRVRGAGRELAVEERVQLVVQRARALRDGDALRDACETAVGGK